MGILCCYINLDLKPFLWDINVHKAYFDITKDCGVSFVIFMEQIDYVMNNKTKRI